VIYRSKELSIIALIKQKPFSNSENASLNRLYAKATLLMFVVTLTSIIVALLTTYNSVIVRRIVVEQNVFNIPRWATMGFSIGSVEYPMYFIAIFAVLALIYVLFARKITHYRAKSLAIAILLILEFLAMIQPLGDGLNDAIAYYHVTTHSAKEFNYTQLTGCFYENASSSAYIIYVNKSYLHGNTIVANLSSCLPFNK
jgi:hypothetical protein